MRKLIAVLLGVGLVWAAGTRAEAAEARGSCNTHVAPICGLGMAPICLCPEASDFSCRWQCVRL